MTTQFKVDPVTNDMVRENGAFVRVDSVEQRLRVKLQFLLGEWFLARDEGMPLLDEVVGRSNIAHVRQLYRTAILEEEGVLSLDVFEVSLDNTTRVATITWAVNGGPVVESKLGPVG